MSHVHVVVMKPPRVASPALSAAVPSPTPVQVERFHVEMDGHTHIAMEWKNQNPSPKINRGDGRAIGGGRRRTNLGGGLSPAAHEVP